MIGKAQAILVSLDIREKLNQIILQVLDHVFSFCFIHVNLKVKTSICIFNLPHFWKRLLIYLEAMYYPRSLNNVNIFCTFIIILEKSIIILIMHYVYKRHIKRQIENIERFVFIWISWKGTNLKWQRGYKDVCPMNI